MMDIVDDIHFGQPAFDIYGFSTNNDTWVNAITDINKHPRNIAIIYIDYKLLIRFFHSNVHKGIYGYWADKLRRLNLEIWYIPSRRNRIANRLSRTIFQEDNCLADARIKHALDACKKDPR